jgi:hypothetical protein
MPVLSSQTRKLQEMFKALQQEKDELRRQHEELKRHVGIRGSGAAAGSGAAGRSGIAARAAGQGSGRQHAAQVSPFHGGAPQMVSAGLHGTGLQQVQASRTLHVWLVDIGRRMFPAGHHCAAHPRHIRLLIRSLSVWPQP